MSDAFWIGYGPALFGLLAGLVSVATVLLYSRGFERKYGRGKHSSAE